MTAPRAELRSVLGPVAVCIGLSACGTDAGPTWSNGVGAIFHEECSSCHRPSGPAPFSLLTHRDAARRADRIATAISDGKMPPWLPSPDGPAMAGERVLDVTQIDAILAWVDAGAPEGDASRSPTGPEWPDGWLMGEPDLIVRSEEGFPVPGEGDEIFRNLVLSTPLDRPRWVRAVELRPGNQRVVHHATVRVDATASSRLQAARDSLPGFDAMFSRSQARTPGAFFLGWTPGRVVVPYGDGMAWRLEPGADFVIQLHLRPTGEPVVATVALGLYFTDEPPDQTPLIIRLGGQTMEVPPGDSDYEVVDDFRLPVAVTALGVYPHAHYLGRSMNAWAETPSGDSISLLDIPRWDFNWQDAYRYADGIPIPAGSTLRIRFVYDNSAANPLNPFDPPRRSSYGPASTDEMAELWLQVLPGSTEDVVTLAQAVVEKDLADRLEGWRHLLTMDPDDPEANFALGSHSQTEGRYDDAMQAYRRVLAARPGDAQVHHNMGLIQEERGDTSAAVRSYERAIEALPAYPEAWNSLGRLQALGGELQRALTAFEQAVLLDPRFPEAQNNLGSVLRDLGRYREAEERYRAAVALDTNFAPARFNRALALVTLGQGEEALLELNRGLSLDPGNAQGALAVAWALATEPDDSARRLDLAADLAAQIRDIVGPHPLVLDVQAAIFAHGGRFLDAVRLAEQAVSEAERLGEPALIPDLSARLALYRSGQAYVRRRDDG